MRRHSLLPLAVTCAFILALFALSWLPSVQQNATLIWSFRGAGAVLLGWCAVLFASARRSGRTLVLDVVLRKQHYMQACAQTCVYLYWGWVPGVRCTRRCR